jgi:hypothetical protein
VQGREMIAGGAHLVRAPLFLRLLDLGDEARDAVQQSRGIAPVVAEEEQAVGLGHHGLVRDGTVSPCLLSPQSIVVENG